MRLVYGLKDVKLIATGKVIRGGKCTTTGELRISTVDFILSRYKLQNVRRVESYAAIKSDRYPILFEVEMVIDRWQRKRCITKFLLQSHEI